MITTSTAEQDDSYKRLPSGSLYERMDSVPDLIRVDSTVIKSTVPASIVNIFKGIVGAGVFSLPAGVASFSDDVSGLAPGLLLAGSLGAISCYSFWSIGRLCLVTNQDTYAGLIEHAYGVRARHVAEAIIVLKVGIACLIYEIIIGDLARDLCALAGFTGLLGQRSFLLCVISTFVLMPLGFLRSFAALAPVAALGSAAMVYVAIFMGLRFAQGAYAPGGAFYADAPFKPSFSKHGTRSMQILVLISMFATAYLAHFNAPKFVTSLAQATPDRFALVSGAGFLLAFAVMGIVMVFGFLTFGGNSQGLILNNYAVTDTLAAIARVATLISVVAGYPFLLVAFRDGVLVRLPTPAQKAKRATSVILVALITCIAVLVDNLGFVVAFVGAVLASTLIYILPPLCLFGAPEMHERGFERAGNVAMLILGIVLAIVGAYVTAK